MGRDTRQKILDSARELFNVHGYNGISLQDIADTVGISKGNLTYHFSKKEEIMEELLSENKPSDLPDKLRTLQDMDALFLHMQQVVGLHSYYFLYHAQLSQLSPKIAEIQNHSYRTIRNLLKEAFCYFYEEGLFRKEYFAGEYDCMIDALHMAIAYWGPFSSLQESIGVDMEYRRHAWGIMYHLLTETGRSEYCLLSQNHSLSSLVSS